MDVADKLEILADAAKYDVACTSSGIDRDAQKGKMGNTLAAGICHSFSADGRCITLLKVLMTNVCVYDCAYCVNRASNEVPRIAFKPRELADLTIAFYRRNYTEGLFLQLRRHPQPRLHHRAHGPDAVHPAPRIRLPRLHPREGRARHLACAHRPAGASGRPHEREHGASLAEEPGAAGSRQEQAAHPGAHAPDQATTSPRTRTRAPSCARRPRT